MSDSKSFKDTPAGMIVVLTMTAVIVGGALAGFFQLVKDKIEANRLAEEKRAIFAVLPTVESYDIIEAEVTIDGKSGKLKIFKGRDGNGAVAGYAFLAKHPGYAAVITMMVGLNVDRETLTGLKVTDQIETPGLGDKIAKEPFESQFRGLSIKPMVVYIKNKKPSKPNEIQALSGATISSKAVTTAINKTVTAVLEVLPVEAFPLEAPPLEPPPLEAPPVVVPPVDEPDAPAVGAEETNGGAEKTDGRAIETNGDDGENAKEDTVKAPVVNEAGTKAEKEGQSGGE